VAKRGKATATESAPAEKPTPRAGTKQALMIDLLRRRGKRCFHATGLA
jgi:hypothetical protein